MIQSRARKILLAVAFAVFCLPISCLFLFSVTFTFLYHQKSRYSAVAEVVYRLKARRKTPVYRDPLEQSGCFLWYLNPILSSAKYSALKNSNLEMTSKFPILKMAQKDEVIEVYESCGWRDIGAHRVKLNEGFGFVEINNTKEALDWERIE